ncbi:KR domain-containing protein [Talaromyces proteolyticus]|uniref:KR domain-containing protein n=1 Tax=Talaromyces proteolyticus TaxID=1131652 RepID=A0AAD4KJ26_9EURO|nr:KR domain-containing protein [Talaromyces proteolyticus]KAH8690512.1 KR domain-containing protein [Talaromyces proteolyticus]
MFKLLSRARTLRFPLASIPPMTTLGVNHGGARWSNAALVQDAQTFDVDSIKKRIGSMLSKSFSIDYLSKVGVTGIAFPWTVLQHYGNSKEMIAQVDVDPDNMDLAWDADSWAAILDSASSIGATVFADDEKLRIVSQIDRLTLYSSINPPKLCYIYAAETDSAECAQSRSADICILNVKGGLLVKIEGIKLTEIEGGAGIGGVWVPPRLSEKPVLPKRVVLISEDRSILDQYEDDLQECVSKVVRANAVQELKSANIAAMLGGKDCAVVYCSGQVQALGDIAISVYRFICEVAAAVKIIVENKLPVKFFIITNRGFAADGAAALAQAPLYGLARIIAMENSDIWGGLIDNEGPKFPILPFKYAQGQDVTRLIDGVPRIARFRPFSTDQRHPASTTTTLLPQPEGTYVITGDLGDLGLETCDFLIEKGARRIVIVSRRDLPPRNQWASTSNKMAPILTLDIGANDAHAKLINSLDHLSLPPVLGVIHASGVLEDNLLVNTTPDSFSRVLSPKISGALALHKAIPPTTVDFFVLYSAIGQLLGTSGQSSYASGNAFLDTLATHRRSQGDNAIAFQWTAWRGLGMANSAFLSIELKSSIAWEHVSKYNVDHAVVTRILAVDEELPTPLSILEDIAVHSSRARKDAAPVESKGDIAARLTAIPELKIWLDQKVLECLALILKIDDIEDIDPRVALTDIGVDSVMTIVLRQKLQSVFKVKVPQTLTWNHPTVVAMVDWFLEQF